MKKNLFLMLGLGAMLLTSCDQDIVNEIYLPGGGGSAFKKLFKALDNASEMIVLKEWLEYLKKNQYKCNVDELKKIAKV